MYYTYRLIPAGFLEVEFPKFSNPVLFQDKLCYSGEEMQNKFFFNNIKSDFNDCFQINDPDYEAGRVGPPWRNFLFSEKIKLSEPWKKVPNKDEIKILMLS